MESLSPRLRRSVEADRRVRLSHPQPEAPAGHREIAAGQFARVPNSAGANRKNGSKEIKSNPQTRQ